MGFTVSVLWLADSFHRTPKLSFLDLIPPRGPELQLRLAVLSATCRLIQQLSWSLLRACLVPNHLVLSSVPSDPPAKMLQQNRAQRLSSPFLP